MEVFLAFASCNFIVRTIDSCKSRHRIILQDFRLPAITVYKTVAERLASEQKFSEIQVLLSNAIQTRLLNSKDHDSIVLALLGMLTDDDKKVRHFGIEGILLHRDLQAYL